MRRPCAVLACLVGLIVSAPMTPAAQSRQVVVFASGAIGSGATNSAQLESEAKGIALILNVTAVSGTNPTLDVKLQQFESLSNQWVDISGAVFQRITGTGQRTLTVYPGPEGPGNLRSVAGTDPAAGQEVSDAVPSNTRWRLISANFALVTSATVANRFPTVVLDDGATTLWRAGTNVAQTASLTATYSAGSAGTFGTVGTNLYEIALPTPPVVLTGGFRIRTSTIAIDTGDNYGPPQYLVEEFIGNYSSRPLPRAWRAVATVGGTASPSFTISLGGNYLY